MASVPPPSPTDGSFPPLLPTSGIPSPSFGAVLIGAFFASLLSGCMLVQLFFYLRSSGSRKDPKAIKFLVAYLVILDLFQLGCQVDYVYDGLITNYGNVFWFLFLTWPLALDWMLTGLITVPIQFFYARRIYILSDKGLHVPSKIVKVMIPLVIVLVSCCSLSFTITSYVFMNKVKIGFLFVPYYWIVYCAIGCSIFADVAIVLCLCFYLSKGRTGFKESDSLIDRLIYLTVNTGLLPTLSDLAHLIAITVAPYSLAHLTFNFLTAKLYTNSFLGVLNARAYMASHLHSSSRKSRNSQSQNGSHSIGMRFPDFPARSVDRHELAEVDRPIEVFKTPHAPGYWDDSGSVTPNHPADSKRYYGMAV